MEKAINSIIILLCGLCFFAIIGGFSDALTSKESAGIIGGCLIALAALGKLPTHKAN